MNNISYHPISENEINEWYCDLKFQNILDHVYYDIVQNGRKFNLDEESLKTYLAIMKMSAQSAKSKNNFDEAHGYNIALVQGLFRKYFYLNNFSFSNLIQEISYFERYTKKWTELVKETITHDINNKLSGEKSSGVYIPINKVVELLHDYNKKGSVRDDLNKFFGDYAPIFVKTLEFAKDNKLGVLEASGVISKDFVDNNESAFDIVIENCDEESLKFKPASHEPNQVEVNKQVENTENSENTEKKSIWKKLFG